MHQIILLNRENNRCFCFDLRFKYHNDRLSQHPKHGNDDIARLRQEVDDLTKEFVQQQEDFSAYQENTQSLLEGLNEKLSNQVETIKGLTEIVERRGDEIVELQKGKIIHVRLKIHSDNQIYSRNAFY